MSIVEQFPQVAQRKRAIVSKSLRSLTKNERALICSFLDKKRQFARTSNVRIPSPGNDLQSGIVRAGNELQSDIVRAGNDLQSGIVRAGNDLQSDIVRAGNDHQSGIVRAGNDLQSDIVRTGITLQSGIVTKEKYEEIFF